MEFAGIEKLSFVDYEGKLNCVLFTKGCNFKCPFCHNAGLVINNDDSFISFEEILTYLKDRKNVLEGVVISGGEPTLHNDLKEKIKEIKNLGYLIKLDTNGSNPTMLKELVNEKLIDYVAMDIKNSFDNYPVTTGSEKVNLDLIKESISFLLENHIDYEFRTTLVNEFHNIDSIKEMLNEIKGAKKLYFQHYKDSENNIHPGLHEVKLEDAKKFADLAANFVEFVSLRGY